MEHKIAVKEYSRSSADQVLINYFTSPIIISNFPSPIFYFQDLPLPRELRPIGVLDRTMAYLLSNIADLGADGQWAEWYDFLWNRTRAIRKDITQQRLCDTQAVALVEKCARYVPQ